LRQARLALERGPPLYNRQPSLGVRQPSQRCVAPPSLAFASLAEYFPIDQRQGMRTDGGHQAPRSFIFNRAGGADRLLQQADPVIRVELGDAHGPAPGNGVGDGSAATGVQPRTTLPAQPERHPSGRVPHIVQDEQRSPLGEESVYQTGAVPDRGQAGEFARWNPERRTDAEQRRRSGPARPAHRTPPEHRSHFGIMRQLDRQRRFPTLVRAGKVARFEINREGVQKVERRRPRCRGGAMNGAAAGGRLAGTSSGGGTSLQARRTSARRSSAAACSWSKVLRAMFSCSET
jgi:hypothetical protein